MVRWGRDGGRGWWWEDGCAGGRMEWWEMRVVVGGGMEVVVGG